MDRRSFLKGGVAAVAVAASGVSILPLAPESTAMITLEDYCNRIMVPYIEGMQQKIAHTILYGNPEWAPVRFTGMIPRYSNA